MDWSTVVMGVSSPVSLWISEKVLSSAWGWPMTCALGTVMVTTLFASGPSIRTLETSTPSWTVPSYSNQAFLYPTFIPNSMFVPSL